MARFARILIIIAVSIFAFSVLTSCAEEPPDHFSGVSQVGPDQPVNTPTTTGQAIEAHARHGLKRAGHEAAWSFLFAGIFALPALTILIIPGVIFRRLEKIIEGLIILLAGIFFMHLASEGKMNDLWHCALWGNAIPGGILFLWGLISKEEEGKLILIALPMLGMGLYIAGLSFHMIFTGFLKEPLWALLSMLPGCGCIWSKLKYFRDAD